MLTTFSSNDRAPELSHSYSAPKLVRNLLQEIGEDPAREGLQRTPERFHKAFLELTSGYALTVEDVVGEGVFDSESTGPIVVKEIEFFSLCEHHLLPFMGTVSIGYVPNEKILGLSKLARIVDVFSKRLQVQERLTREIADAIFSSVDAKAVMVSVEASHMCMSMRGVKKISSRTRTVYQLGFDKLDTEEKEILKRGVE
jgi:GTP cyclohydrolase I